MPPFRLRQLTFSDGKSVPVSPNSIVVLVGPNNSGKSRALRDVNAYLQNPNLADVAVVTDVQAEKDGGPDDLWSWLEAHAHVREENGEILARRPQAPQIQRIRASNIWQEAGSRLEELTNFLVLLGNTENRLQLATTVQSFDPTAGQPEQPLHELFINADLEERLADATERAFGKRVTVNRAAGTQIHLHLGSVRDVPEPRDVRNAPYLEALKGLNKIQDEGDGIRSYVGILLSLIASNFPLVLLDEPEAFLHPPQAQQLARELVELVPKGDAQLVVATHSSEFIEGILDSGTADVTIVRLSRDGTVNHVAELAPAALQKVWRDPLLRYSALLDGLFHPGVVLCEADSDCRFYQATLDAIVDREGARAHDLLFTYTGGKDRLPVAISAMRAIDVDVQVITDIDVLASGRKMKELVEALGKSWAPYERDYNMTLTAALQRGSAPKNKDVIESLQRAIEELDPTKDLTQEQGKAIAARLKIETGWKQLQRAGIRDLPGGQSFEAAQRLLKELRQIGFHIVPVGTLEGWDKEIGRHGPAWVSEALERSVHTKSGPHADFVGALLPRGQDDDK